MGYYAHDSQQGSYGSMIEVEGDGNGGYTAAEGDGPISLDMAFDPGTVYGAPLTAVGFLPLSDGDSDADDDDEDFFPDGPLAVDGYFPLFADEQEAIDYIVGATAAHTHEVIDDQDGTHTMYMPTADSGTYHGDYPTDTEYEDTYLDIV